MVSILLIALLVALAVGAAAGTAAVVVHRQRPVAPSGPDPDEVAARIAPRA